VHYAGYDWTELGNLYWGDYRFFVWDYGQSQYPHFGYDPGYGLDYCYYGMPPAWEAFFDSYGEYTDHWNGCDVNTWQPSPLFEEMRSILNQGWHELADPFSDLFKMVVDLLKPSTLDPSQPYQPSKAELAPPFYMLTYKETYRRVYRLIRLIHRLESYPGGNWWAKTKPAIHMVRQQLASFQTACPKIVQAARQAWEQSHPLAVISKENAHEQATF
jgi:hypothetical protein